MVGIQNELSKNTRKTWIIERSSEAPHFSILWPYYPVGVDGDAKWWSRCKMSDDFSLTTSVRLKPLSLFAAPWLKNHKFIFWFGSISFLFAAEQISITLWSLISPRARLLSLLTSQFRPPRWSFRGFSIFNAYLCDYPWRQMCFYSCRALFRFFFHWKVLWGLLLFYA